MNQFILHPSSFILPILRDLDRLCQRIRMGTEPSFLPYAEAATMKSLSQIVLAIGAVVVLVAGVTFVSQYQVGGTTPTTTPTTTTETVSSGAEVKVNFFRGTIWEWKPPSAGQFEQQTTGWHDFWFQNDNQV